MWKQRKLHYGELPFSLLAAPRVSSSNPAQGIFVGFNICLLKYLRVLKKRSSTRGWHPLKKGSYSIDNVQLNQFNNYKTRLITLRIIHKWRYTTWEGGSQFCATIYIWSPNKNNNFGVTEIIIENVTIKVELLFFVHWV